MTHRELIDRVSGELDISKSETRQLIAETVSVLSTQLRGVDNEGYTIPGVGTFKTRLKDIHKIYNPHYGKYMLVPPKRVVEFSPGKELKRNTKFNKSDK